MGKKKEKGNESKIRSIIEYKYFFMARLSWIKLVVTVKESFIFAYISDIQIDDIKYP